MYKKLITKIFIFFKYNTDFIKDIKVTNNIYTYSTYGGIRKDSGIRFVLIEALQYNITSFNTT